MDLGIAKFRIAKFSHCEFCIAKFSHCEVGIGFANLKLALRNGLWHCEISHCEIGRLLRSAQCPAATVPLLLHPAASHPASTASHFLHFALVFLLIYGLFDG